MFVDYIIEDGEYKGVNLLVDYGGGYCLPHGGTKVSIRLGEVFKFTHDGVWIDDEGCPEDYYIKYTLSLSLFDEEKN